MRYVMDIMLKRLRQRQRAVLIAKTPGVSLIALVSIKIPQFIEQVKLGNFAEAARIIAEDNSFLQFAGVYVLRRANVKASAYSV